MSSPEHSTTQRNQTLIKGSWVLAFKEIVVWHVKKLGGRVQIFRRLGEDFQQGKAKQYNNLMIHI